MPSASPNLLAVQAKEREAARLRIKHSPPVQRPVTQSQSVADHATRYSLAQRVQTLTYLSLGYSTREIQDWIGVPPRQSQRILKKAVDRGYRPKEDRRILDYFVEDGVRSGRPREISQVIEQAIINEVIADRSGREKSSEFLAYQHGISASSVLRILRRYHFSSVKPTRKPGLNKIQRLNRLEFCLRHQHWTLEDWKNVIWSDETSVILGQRRGAIRIWRRSYEAVEKSVIRNRWKGFSEFMFWGSFSYDKKGPCHIWGAETAKERKEAENEVRYLNDLYEPEKKDEWLLTRGLLRLQLRPRVGRKVQWKFTKSTGKLIRGGKVELIGIDIIRYDLSHRFIKDLAKIKDLVDCKGENDSFC